MTGEAILLVGRAAEDRTAVLETHADRIADCGVVDSVHVATYEQEPVRELRPQLSAVTAETVYVVPMCVAHDHESLDAIPGALSYLSGTVRYCEPIGGSDAVTRVLESRAAETLPPGEDTTLIIVAFGSSSKPYHAETADYHATRLRERSAYESVLTCYLLQNPAVECVRYNVATSRAVAVPLFVSRTEATTSRIPEALELDRGGIEYADPLGTHPKVTEAVLGEVEKQRALEGTPVETSFEARLVETQRPTATDGEGL